MSLAPGTRFGLYEIRAAIGAGGMGEVYRARDSRLNRDVAIKILPELFATDADRLMRFQREAEVLASLNHPNIAHIHGLEDIDGVRALVLELVDGETLAERLAHGPLPVDEALSIARQIAEALEAAHEHGVIHRDLKPANIKITTAGVVKVLDFGLAKTSSHDPASSSLSMSPTMTSPAMATHAGMILGTAAYMAPEQARGKTVDKRADIWAFGVVLFEMLTGRTLYGGDTITDVLAGIITREPDWSLLPAETPDAARRLLARCIEKDAKRRLRDIGEARVALIDPADLSRAVVERPSQGRRTKWIVAAGLAIAWVAVLIPAILYFRSPAPSSKPNVSFEIPLQAPINQAITISPDGRHIVYLARTSDSKNALWLRSLDALDASMLPGTEGARPFTPEFWSPDSRFIGFFADGKLKKVDLTGGVPETIMTIDTQFGGGAWNRAGTILVASNDHGLRRISASGGDAVEVTERDRSLDETYHDCPSFLPDGRHFVYLAYSENQPQNRAVYIGALDSKARTRLMASDFCAAYAPPGVIMFLRGKTLMARPFDADRLEFTGDAVPIAQDVAAFSGGEMGVFAVSDEGTVIYRKALAQTATRRLLWMDRSGKASPPIGAPLGSAQIQLSPDGKRVLFAETVEGINQDIWVYDIARDVKVRLTTDPSMDHNPIWSPDGSSIAFDSHRNGGIGIYGKPSSGAVPEQILLESEPAMQQGPREWSRDGRFIIYMKSKTDLWDIWVLPLVGDRKPFPYIVSPFNDVHPALSPNGRWLAYVSNQSGKYQVIVQPFPDPSGGRWQISTEGGSYPRWRHDGRELYYLTPAGEMVAVSVTIEPQFDIGKSTPLFQTPVAFAGDPGGFPYDVAADGRFLLAAPVAAENASPITVQLNWTSALKQ